MGGGLYSTELQDFDKTLDLTQVKPYGDTMNDGKVQLSFTLPVPFGPEAVEAAKQLLRSMGMENPRLSFPGTDTGLHVFNCYGNLQHTVNMPVFMCPRWKVRSWTCTG